MATEALNFGQRRALPEFLENYLPDYLNGGGYTASVEGVYDLLQLTPVVVLNNPQKVFVSSFYKESEYGELAGEGFFYWNSDEPKSNHNGVTKISNTVPWNGTYAGLSAFYAKTGETSPGGTGCWVRIYNTLTVDMAGATADPSTDDSIAFAQASTIINALGGGVITFSRDHLIDNNLSVLEYTHFKGSLENVDAIRPALPGDYDGKASKLTLNSAKTITPQASASLGNCLIMRKGLDLPFADAAAATTGIAAFAGTAITLVNAGPAPYLHHMLILGFEKAIAGTLSAGRARIEYVQGDCTNGIEIYGALDICDLYGCEFWPYTTAPYSWVTDALKTRSGTAYYFHDTADWCRMTNCFSYGYNKGTDLYNVNSFTYVNCGHDWTTNNPAATSTGIHIRGTCVDIKLIGPQVAAQGTGILVDCSTSSRLSVTISQPTVWNCDSYGIRVINGRTMISAGGGISNCPVGIEVDATCDDLVSVDGIDFYNCTTPINSSSTGRANLRLGDNLRYTSCTPTITNNLPVVKTADFAVQGHENNIVNNKSGGTCNVQLPTATIGRKPIKILNYQAQLVISVSSNVVPITGGAAGTAILPATAGKWVELIPDGTNWLIMSGNI